MENVVWRSEYYQFSVHKSYILHISEMWSFFYYSSRERNEVMHLLRRNPNLSRDLLAQKYPNVDIQKMVREDKIRGHYVPQ